MKLLRILALFAFGGLLSTATAFGQNRSFDQPEVQKDKAMHFGVSAAAQTACTALGRLVTHSKWGTQVTCFMTVNAVGVVKEVTDPYRGGTRDERDIYANLAGSGFSFFVLSIAF